MLKELFKFACIVAIIACDSTGPEQTSLLFDGTVTEAGTSAPIADASVSVADFSGSNGLVGKNLQSTRTDSQGRYTLSYNACASDPWMTIVGMSYQSKDFKVGCRAERQTVDISLTRTP